MTDGHQALTRRLAQELRAGGPRRSEPHSPGSTLSPPDAITAPTGLIAASVDVMTPLLPVGTWTSWLTKAVSHP